MNLFFLFLNAKLAAAAYNDKHLVKIILECHTMLAAAWVFHNKQEYDVLAADLKQKFNVDAPRITHINHGTVKWVRTTYQNYEWAAQHLLALYEEYDTVYCLDKSGARLTVTCPLTQKEIPKFHKYHHSIQCLTKNFPPALEKTRGETSLTLPHLAMPKQYQPTEEYTSWDQAIQAYRMYYLDSKRFYVTKGKRRPFVWSHGRKPPEFWIPNSDWTLSDEAEEKLANEERKYAEGGSKKKRKRDAQAKRQAKKQKTAKHQEKNSS